MSMPCLTREEIASRGKDLYENRIRTLVEEAHRGEYVAIDVQTGEYEVDPVSLAAAQVLRNRLPDAHVFFVRIGLPPVRLGGLSSGRNS